MIKGGQLCRSILCLWFISFSNKGRWTKAININIFKTGDMKSLMTAFQYKLSVNYWFRHL